MDRSDQICAIIDAQGYTINGVFYPREVGISPMNNDLTYSFNVRLPFCEHLLSERENYAVKYCEKYIHGLPLNPYALSNNVDYDKLKDVLNKLYNKFKRNDCDVFGVRNPQFEKVLTKFEIPCVNLDTIGCPSLRNLNVLFESRKMCFNHKPIEIGDRVRYNRMRLEPTCAGKKTDTIRLWLRFLLSFKQFTVNGS
jgi:hypothetical protein